MSTAEAVGTFIGNVIGVALFPALAVWALRCTRTGREIWQGLVNVATWPRRSREAERARCRHERYVGWVAQLAYWGHVLGQNDPGTPQFELAHDAIVILEANRPERCYCPACKPPPCPAAGFTCNRPCCLNHPRSTP